MIKGWLAPPTRRMLGIAFADAGVWPGAIVVELGAFLGLSTRWILDKTRARVISVDIWSQEHADRIRKQNEWPEFGPVFDQFLANLWPFQRRLTPVRLLSQAALVEIHALGIRPNLIYVDAGHRYRDVEADLLISQRLFPGVILVGDDWTWSTVRSAVEDHARATGRKLFSNETAWRLDL